MRSRKGTRQRDGLVAKLETFNPGNSIQDRMALKMIEDAERSGALKTRRHDHRRDIGQRLPGWELAIAAVVKGYKCVFTTTDRSNPRRRIDRRSRRSAPR